MSLWMGTRDGGELVAADEARISPFDHGFTVGDGVFETLKVTADGPFALTRHLRRLASSAALLGLPAPDESVLRSAVHAVVDAESGPSDSPPRRLRMTYTAGPAPLGSERDGTPPTLVVALGPASARAEATSAVTVPWTRNERSAVAGIKSTSYAENVVALAYAQAAGASEALFANTAGDLCEGTGSNVFVVLDGIVLTPPLASGCLPGITRELVVEWFDVVEADLPMSVLDEADEVFVTSSTRDVQPVVVLDDRRWPGAGPIATGLRAAFADRSSADVDP